MKMSKKEYRKEKGLVILSGLIFGLFGFIGSYTANYLWWEQQQSQRYLVISGTVALVAFFGIAIFLLYRGKNW